LLRKRVGLPAKMSRTQGSHRDEVPDQHDRGGCAEGNKRRIRYRACYCPTRKAIHSVNRRGNRSVTVGNARPPKSISREDTSRWRCRHRETGRREPFRYILIFMYHCMSEVSKMRVLLRDCTSFKDQLASLRDNVPYSEKISMSFQRCISFASLGALHLSKDLKRCQR
jgi:hypothetical protein